MGHPGESGMGTPRALDIEGAEHRLKRGWASWWGASLGWDTGHDGHRVGIGP